MNSDLEDQIMGPIQKMILSIVWLLRTLAFFGQIDSEMFGYWS